MCTTATAIKYTVACVTSVRTNKKNLSIFMLGYVRQTTMANAETSIRAFVNSILPW